jgi:hypothetical protein
LNELGSKRAVRAAKERMGLGICIFYHINGGTAPSNQALRRLGWDVHGGTGTWGRNLFFLVANLLINEIIPGLIHRIINKGKILLDDR